MPSASLIKEFEQLVGKENVFSSEADRQSYAYDAAVLKPMIPSLVVRPTEVEQLGQVVKRCYEEGIPMTVRGSGTNLTGGTIPDCSDTIVILTTGLNKILEINTEDLYATVQPGVITAKFAAAVAAKGLFYPPDPGSMSVSTIGGNVAESSGGLRGLKYGTTKDYVMGMEVFANTGDLVKTGSRTVKCATGYNIAPLLVGSEGTLGMISRAILKLVPPPQASKAMMAVFDNVQKASEAVARSKIPAMMKVIKGLGEKYNLTVGTFGHAGDGNLHPTFMCDKRDKDEFERVERAVDELFNTTIEMGGTLSGEHGIGTAKQKWLEKETSRGTIGYSRRLRKAIDPKGLFNPSKLVGV